MNKGKLIINEVFWKHPDGEKEIMIDKKYFDIDTIKDTIWYNNKVDWDYGNIDPDSLMRTLEFYTTPAEVRQVVYCKDCMHSVQGKKSLECEKHRYVWNNLNRWVNDDDFCCWGVKRGES